MSWPSIKGTAVLKALNGADGEKALLFAAEILKRGGLVAFPTETVYGLGGDALNPGAVKKIYQVKRRPPDNPLIIHVAGMEEAARLAEEIPPEALLLAEKFWPGPLTMVLPKKDLVPGITTAGLSSAAIRVPAHPLARKLIRAAGIPLAAPSANLSGRPSPTSAGHVLEDLAGSVDAVLDGGSCSVGVESTVISLLSGTPALLRPGGITLEMLEDVLKREVLDLTIPGKGAAAKGAPLSPGMKYRHYAPRAPLYLVLGDYPAQQKQLLALTENFLTQGRRVALLLSRESAGIYPATVLRVLGSRKKPAQIAKRLFAILREMDSLEMDVIVVEGIDERGIGKAIMNRLRKAAAEIIETNSTGSACHGGKGGEEVKEDLKILFVCTGNTCRSVMAEGLFQKMWAGLADKTDKKISVKAGSAGVGAFSGLGASPEALKILREENVDLSGHLSRQLDSAMIRMANYIYTMTEDQKNFLRASYPEAAAKIFLLHEVHGKGGKKDISDPIGKGIEHYRAAAEEIKRALAVIIGKLLNADGGQTRE